MADAPEQDPYRAHRERIDAIDRELLALLNRRAEIALEIGHLKRVRNEPIHVPARERAVLDRLRALNPGPLGDDAVEAIFTVVIEHIREREENSAEA